MFVFYCVVSNSLYCRAYLFISWGSNFVYVVSFLSMIIYEVLYTWCLRYNIYSTWFLDIRISTCYPWNSFMCIHAYVLCVCMRVCVCVCAGSCFAPVIMHPVIVFTTMLNKLVSVCLKWKLDSSFEFTFIRPTVQVNQILIWCSLVHCTLKCFSENI